ncbi:MAG: hypothetical protein DRG24_05170 [Epsilonproteobacteria bacterium]|nr:MAG: hypothetical protein DRG24_05170 [Campylobacterota bacterium]
MKYLILLIIPLFLFADEQRVLISGISIHEKTNDRFGEKYNAFNYGAGYEYNFFDNFNEVYFGGNILVLNDSFENPQFTVGMGHYIRFDTGAVDTAIGLSGFVGWKKIYDDGDLSRDDGAYGFTGGIAPAVTFYYDRLSVNLMYVPSIHYKNIDITGFLFAYFSFRIYK